jgi:3-isopropylmalate/(R)-2-methylmalate dehydratase small subunit
MSREIEWRPRGTCHKFGDNVPHLDGVVPEWIVNGRHFEPAEIIPELFEMIRPGFHKAVKTGDIVVTGKNFGMGPKMNGYIGMQALGLGLLCESMPFLAYRAALGCGLRVLDHCPGITGMVEQGDDIEIDFTTGEFVNHTRDTRANFEPIPESLRDMIVLGGTQGWLKQWWEDQESKS